MQRKYETKLDEKEERAKMFPQSLDDDVKRNWEQLMKEMPRLLNRCPHHCGRV